MKIERIHIAVFVAIAALVWWITLVYQGTSVTWKHATPFTVVVSVLGVFGFIFEHVLWHCRLFHGWFFKRPDLRGTWRVVLKANYISPETGKRVSKIVCYMGIKQTLSELKMHLMTPDSESWSITGHVVPSQSGNGYQVICVYTNEPNIHLRDERVSEMHKGTLIIHTHGSGIRPNTLTAQYWTDRKTMGAMDFNCRVNKVFTRFEDAKRHFEQR